MAEIRGLVRPSAHTVSLIIPLKTHTANKQQLRQNCKVNKQKRSYNEN